MENLNINPWKYYYKLTQFYYNLYLLLTKSYFYGPDYKQISLFLRDNGPVFIKIGQNLMNKPLIAEDFRNELKTLGNENFHNATISIDDIKLDTSPIAAGSIAQVWKGTLNNKTIILKKLHDNIREDTVLSIKLFENMKTHFSNYRWFSYADSLIEFDEVYSGLINQLDFQNEINNLNKFEEIFKDFSNKIILPTIINYTDEYIIESYEVGLRFNEFIEIHKEHKDEVSNLIHCCFYLMFFSNFMHGDLHESNFLLRLHDIHGVQIVLLDFGIVSQFNSNETFLKFISLFRKNVFFPDQRKIISFLKDVNINQDAESSIFVNVAHDFLNSLDYENKMKIMMKGKWDPTDRSLDVGIIFQQILDFALQYKMKFQGSILNVCNGFLLIDDYRNQCTGNTTTWQNKIKYAKDNGFYKVFEDQVKKLFDD